jgi:hypothetical protein
MSDAGGLPVDEFQRIVEEAQTLTFLPRATELQIDARLQIDNFLAVLAARKAECVNALDEAGANALLAMELSLETVSAELAMWIELKQDAPEAGWNSLVSAQNSCEAAAAVRRQIGVDATGLENLLQKLLIIERFVFPPQMFASIGGTVDRRDCSICGGNYEACGHIKGRAYMGQLCHTLIVVADLKEVSMVTNPADKRCRLTHFSAQGKMRNKMTWRLEDRPDHASPTIDAISEQD